MSKSRVATLEKHLAQARCTALTSRVQRVRALKARVGALIGEMTTLKATVEKSGASAAYEIFNRVEVLRGEL